MCARIAYINFNADILEKVDLNTKIQEQFLKLHCKKVIEGVEILIDWTTKKLS